MMKSELCPKQCQLHSFDYLIKLIKNQNVILIFTFPNIYIGNVDI